MARHAARRAAMQMVYEQMLGGEGGEETLYQMIDYPKDDEDIDYLNALVDGSTRRAVELDQIIQEHSPLRDLDRIPYVTRAILRLSLYEIIHVKDTPVSVVINEAVEMTKRYALPEDGRFINGLLGAYCRAKNLE